MDIKTINKAFIEDLKKIAKDRGNRAALRCYWSTATQHKAYSLLAQLGALKSEPRTILAALYAEHAKRENFNADLPQQDIGKAAREIGKDKFKKDEKHPYEMHFRRLLASNSFDELARQLHRLVKRLEREQIGLDYEQLLINLFTWKKADKVDEPQKREKIKIGWAADFWQSPIPSTNQEDAEL